LNALHAAFRILCDYPRTVNLTFQWPAEIAMSQKFLQHTLMQNRNPTNVLHARDAAVTLLQLNFLSLTLGPSSLGGASNTMNAPTTVSN
jgi:hypothetical protein